MVVSHEQIQQRQQDALEDDISLLSTYLNTELNNGPDTSPSCASVPGDGKGGDQGPKKAGF